jgi:hypothetical protein
MVSLDKDTDESEFLHQLYPVPPSTGVVSLPGPTDASARALLDVLLHNRENYHIFFNDKGFHKYVVSVMKLVTSTIF